MSWREMLVLVLAFCFLAQTGLPQAKRQRQSKRIPLDLVRLYADEECINREYGGSIRKFANDLETNSGSFSIDLNGDNKLEYVIFPPAPCGLCGSGGCPISVYQEQTNGRGWALLLTRELGYVETVKKTVTNGYRDLVVASQAGAGNVMQITYKLIEGGYKPSGCLRIISEAGERPKTFKCYEYSVRLFNCDDGCRVYVNGEMFLEMGFGAGDPTDDTDITPSLNSGQNQIRFEVINKTGGIAYGFQVLKNRSVVFERVCGQAGVVGCENNRMFPSGVAREFTYTIVK